MSDCLACSRWPVSSERSPSRTCRSSSSPWRRSFSPKLTLCWESILMWETCVVGLRCNFCVAAQCSHNDVVFCTVGWMHVQPHSDPGPASLLAVWWGRRDRNWGDQSRWRTECLWPRISCLRLKSVSSSYVLIGSSKGFYFIVFDDSVLL